MKQQQAFPTTINHEVLRGMTLRDYFAAAAMPLMYKFWMEDFYHPDNEDAENRTDGRTDINPVVMKLISDHAYELAKEMMRSRELK
jgi:hypothetical protein